ncbi:hypothetical protein FGSG_04040 [Fusarium graminearum PH-1]|nr:hypothetical protein FGSG_04040 [Fusarium graminearum PH-1]ESU09114.1 hypothetical protein FGSG_04040 [Fusarium graminearum PH-1]SCB65891.1 unnamed protein product [Fusarium graminearum]|eukprot:XP_011321613.1 hypothetical protein FGSG_04040 [Fusarium graminearum PH-1]
MSDAFALAAREVDEDSEGSQAVDASPSPAPRTWRERNQGNESQLRQTYNQSHLETKAPSRPFSRGSFAASRIPEAKHSPGTASPRQRTFYGKSRAGLPFGLKEQTLRPETNGVQGGSRPGSAAGIPRPESASGIPRPGSNWGLRHMPSKDDLTKQGRIPELVPGIEDLLPSIEGPDAQNGPVNPEPAEASPEKSFAWQVDDDFTAGELQMSDSPRIRMGDRPFANRIHFDEASEIDINSRTRVAHPGARNTKLDEIRSREVKTGSDLPVEPWQSHNTKIDEIRAREERVEHQIPIPDRNAPRPRNTKLDTIRQREVNGIPRRSMASIRLDEIREQNAMTRSRSPEDNRPQTSRGMVPETKSNVEIETQEPPPRPKSAFETAGERIPDTPVTIYKSQRENVEPHQTEEEFLNNDQNPARLGLSHRRTDSRDLLRRLARAASSSPAPEPGPRQVADTDKPASVPQDPKPDAASTISQPSTSNGFRNRQQRRKDSDTKPTVGFTGLPRSRSTDSVKSKKSMNSDADPTARLEAEANLFAPGDNHSERGSIKAPSPEPDSDSDDEKNVGVTPRPSKPDPLAMPTPKIMGAYVETPATVKVEKFEVKDKQHKAKKEERPLRQRSASFRDKRTDHATSGSDRDTASDPGTDDKLGTETSSSGVRRRRTRSLSRRRGTLKNSARLPTVKDDLKELQRTHHIEDSTLDDLEEVILGRRAPSRQVEALLDKLPQDSSFDDDFDFDLELDTKLNTRTNQIDPQNNDNSDLDRLTRMNKTLKSSLYGIHTAARGIERLSDQVSTKNKAADKAAEEKAIEDKAAEEKATEDKPVALNIPKEEPVEKNLLDIIKPEPVPEKMVALHDSDGTCPAYIAHPDAKTVSYIQFPVPQLYRRKPFFRFTFLGLVLFLLGSWYLAESAMCAQFCRPIRCSGSPCVWSVNDPTFGNAIPVKLDQWATGGRGRILAEQFKEEVGDWVADMVDVYYDREITDIDINKLSFEQKRQHRRRLRKKGLVKPRVQTAEQRAKWEAWRQARREQERQKEAREMGYEIAEDEDETVGGDQKVW